MRHVTFSPVLIRQITDERLAQNAYLIGCQAAKQALLIDPQRDIDRYLEAARRDGLAIVAVAETHIHADFASGAREFAHRMPSVRLYLSEEGAPEWSSEWAKNDPPRVGETVLVRHGRRFSIGKVDIDVVHTPGHTPEHIAFLITDRGAGADEPMAMVSGDFVFVGDLGRPDLLETAAGEAGAREPAARQLYASARDFVKLPEWIQVLPGHGAGSACGKALGAIPNSTVGYEKRFSPALRAAAGDERAFVDFILDGQPDPPRYFARMKKWNRSGPPLLRRLPEPRRIDAADLAEMAASAAAGGPSAGIIADTRLDRPAYHRAHLRGSLYAPFDRDFPTTVASYVEPDTLLILLIDEADLEAAVRSLVRVGVDRIEHWAPPEILARREFASLIARHSVITFPELARARADRPGPVLDVRNANEVALGAIPGSTHVSHVVLAGRSAELPPAPPEQPFYVHCGAGKRAAIAASWLERSGRDAVVVDDSFANWRGV